MKRLSAHGEAVVQARGATESLRESVGQQPLAALAIAGAVGLPPGTLNPAPVKTPDQVVRLAPNSTDGPPLCSWKTGGRALRIHSAGSGNRGVQLGDHHGRR